MPRHFLILDDVWYMGVVDWFDMNFKKLGVGRGEIVYTAFAPNSARRYKKRAVVFERQIISSGVTRDGKDILLPNQIVEFKIMETLYGPTAVDIKVIGYVDETTGLPLGNSIDKVKWKEGFIDMFPNDPDGVVRENCARGLLAPPQPLPELKLVRRAREVKVNE